MAEYFGRYQIDNAMLRAMSAQQQYQYQAEMQREIAAQMAQKMAKDIKFKTYTSPTSNYSTCIEGYLPTSSDYHWKTTTSDCTTGHICSSKPEPVKKSSPKRYFGSFYERLKAEIDDWLSGVRADLCLG